MDLNRIYDYMTGRPDTYKGLKGVGYEDFEKNMGDARYRRNIYNQLYINGGINSKYDAFDSSWQKTYGAGRDSSRPLEMTTGEVLPYIDLDSEKTLGEEDFSRYEAEQNPTSTMDTYDYEQMRIDPEREEKRINALRDELDSEGVTPESVLQTWKRIMARLCAGGMRRGILLLLRLLRARLTSEWRVCMTIAPRHGLWRITGWPKSCMARRGI